MRMNSTSIPLCRMPAQGFAVLMGGASAAASSWKSFGALRARPAPILLILAFPVAGFCGPVAIEQLGVVCAVALGRDVVNRTGDQVAQRLAYFYAANERFGRGGGQLVLLSFGASVLQAASGIKLSSPTNFSHKAVHTTALP